MLILIENGELYTPKPHGCGAVLLMGNMIVQLGHINRRAVEALGLDVEVIDATGCLVTPGFIDPHEHLLGGSGEQGFSTQTPEISLNEIVTAGITTVVGCLGVDTTMKTMPGLLAKAKALREEGLSAFLYSGGYNVPPTTIMSSIRDDLLFIDEVIGAGEIAIADDRSTDPDPRELARLVSDAHVGGMLSRKAGVTHFHVGERQQGLSLLRTVLDHYDTHPAWLYPTHIERNETLMREAIALTRLGTFVDVDTVEEDLPRWLRFYLEEGGNPNQLTVSSDASLSSPHTLYKQIRACIREHGFPPTQVLALVTTNTAKVLKLDTKGELAPGKDADVLVLRKDSLEIVEVIARGRRLVRNGQLTRTERCLTESNRRILLYGQKYERPT
jgi:beta-aspartyl-dipeptidase (metallo-type)